MSGKIKSRSAANSDSITGGVSCDERILRDCHQLYTDPDSGLIPVAESVGVKLLPPRKKITVLLMGNHSAGKSSFINWYVEEHIQRTGVAIETQGFSFVTSGRKRESLTGNATLHLYPHFKPLQEFKGVSEYLSTEICTSRQKRFSLVTFVDSPGLVDGDMKYPFDVDEVILWLGDLCDLILVFFDPMGQALCKRTLNIVESLNEKHGDRLRFYLSKADEAGGESDRQRVMMQIVQELCKRPGLNKCGFDMPTIYIPNPNKPSRCINQIEEVCRTIEKTINQTVQNTLNSLERDCELIVEEVSQCHHSLLDFIFIHQHLRHLHVLMLFVPSSSSVSMPCVFTANLITLLPLILCRTQPTLSTKQKRQLQEKLEYVQEVVKTKKVVCMCGVKDALIRYQFADCSNPTKPKPRYLYGCQN
uniref:Si:ch211-11k18.4 n=1 Tax=Oreochromis niloticus TaxID=8128 RepID=A0A669BR53_ORENI